MKNTVTKKSEKNWSNKCILVAEDEESNFQLLYEILLPTKVKLIRAMNGKEAIEIYESCKNLNLILLDIKMPVMDGLEAISYIRKRNKEIPIIAQTVFAMAENRKKGKEAGFTEYITKPIIPKNFLATLAIYLDD